MFVRRTRETKEKNDAGYLYPCGWPRVTSKEKGEGVASHQIRLLVWGYQQTHAGRASVWFVTIIASKNENVRNWRVNEQSQLEFDRRAREAGAVDHFDAAGYVDAMVRQNRLKLTE
jgi:hypothetical protein